MNKIIFVNRYFYPDQSATSQILTDLLTNINSTIQSPLHVVTSRNTYQNDMKLRSFESYNNIDVHRVWTTRFGRQNLAGRAIDYLTFYLSTFVKLLSITGSGDVVVAKTDPPVVGFIVYIVVKLKRAHQINWIQDLFPDVAGALNVLNKNSIMYRILAKISRVSMANSIMNVAIGERMADLLVKQGVDRDRIDIVHNWNVNKEVEYIEKVDNELVREWGLQNKFVVSYSGNFGRAHEYKIIEELIRRYADRPDIIFLFIGGGKYYDELRSLVEQEGLQNVMFRPYQDRSMLNLSLSVADIHLISLKPELEGLIVPSKFYGLASIGAPMIFIGATNGELGSILTRNTAGYVVSSQDIDELCRLIDDMSGKPTSRDSISRNLKRVYNKNYQPSVAYDHWSSILNEATK